MSSGVVRPQRGISQNLAHFNTELHRPVSDPFGIHSGPRPGAPAVLPADVESLERFVFQHGLSFDSYLATEPGRSYFWSRRGPAMISYVRVGKHVLVGGGLIGPPEHHEDLLDEIVDQASRAGLRVAFHNVSDDELPLFQRHGFQVTKWGEEPVIDLGQVSWSGKAYEWVRRQVNYCQRNGLQAYEVHASDLEPDQWGRTLAEVREVAAESLSRKAQSREMRFFEGRIDDHALGLRRLFIARSNYGAGRMEGFLVCNPLRNGTMWATELYRHRTDSVRGTIACLFHHTINTLQAEGVKRACLCLDPGRNCETPIPGDSWLIRRGLMFSERYLSWVFDAAGLRHFKSRFRPRYENRYVCCRPGASIGSLMAFFRVFGSFRLNYANVASILRDRLRKQEARRNLSDAQ